MVTEIELHAREHGCEEKQTTLQSDTRVRQGHPQTKAFSVSYRICSLSVRYKGGKIQSSLARRPAAVLRQAWPAGATQSFSEARFVARVHPHSVNSWQLRQERRQDSNQLQAQQDKQQRVEASKTLTIVQDERDLAVGLVCILIFNVHKIFSTNLRFVSVCRGVRTSSMACDIGMWVDMKRSPNTPRHEHLKSNFMGQLRW